MMVVEQIPENYESRRDAYLTALETLIKDHQNQLALLVAQQQKMDLCC